MPKKKDKSGNPDSNPRVVIDFAMLRQYAARNFRDLGGHPTLDGRRVRTARVYRSSHLAEIPVESPLSRLHLRTLVTLQSRVEVKHLGAPEPVGRRGLRWEHIPMGDEWFNNKGYTRISKEPGREHLALVMHFRNDWRRFFKLLAERDVYPLLFHCSAGRDRTGVGAAMLLSMLGVDRERIVADFLESNLVFTKALLAAEQLHPVFELIDENGGIEGFAREVIGLDAGELATIRESLVEA
ncbi:MAG TPA: tyrosine-protein phosphatase [Candidatus Acidoferrales bacterium]|nr:tyrosine-protein phosphatase [Candidatus Acidoferrales bacterium]